MGAILTVQEVAERMRCEHRTVRRAIKSGELEAALIGGKWLVREEAVGEWFRSRCVLRSRSRSPRRPVCGAPARSARTVRPASSDFGRWTGGAILRRAVVRGLMPVNAAQLVDKPKQRPTQLPQPLAPVTVERIRAIMLQPRTRIVPAAGAGKRSRRAYETSVGTLEDRQRNALIVSMLAYAGLRPIEDRGCTWGDLRDRTLHVFATKTNRSRDVNLFAPLAEDLAEWRAACGGPQDDELVIPRPSRGP